MSRRLLTLILTIIYLTGFSFAQDLYFCESYTEDGQPIGPINKLEIKPYGTAIYILLDNNSQFNDPLLYLFIDKLVDDKFVPHDSKTINVKNEDDWAVTSYEFSEQGIYEAYFLNSSQSRIATGRLSTYFSEEYTNQVFTPTSRSSGDCEFVFCELVINGKPVNQFNSVSLARTEGQVFIYLNYFMPFGIDKFQVQVWERSTSNSNYEELIDSKKFKILPEWEDTFFRYIFRKVGEYKIDIYDDDNNFIASNVITVTK
jgi:hypothetical protein